MEDISVFAGAEKSQSVPVSEPPRVLVVDDNVAGAETLAMLLGMIGYEAEVAVSGKAAIDAFRRGCPRIVLLDLCLPDMNGFDVARTLRSLPGAERTLIIALSGISPDGTNSEKDGAIDYRLTKPISIELLEDLLKRLSGGSAVPQGGHALP